MPGLLDVDDTLSDRRGAADWRVRPLAKLPNLLRRDGA